MTTGIIFLFGMVFALFAKRMSLFVGLVLLFIICIAMARSAGIEVGHWLTAQLPFGGL